MLDESNIDPSDVIPVPIFSNPPKLNEGVTELKVVILFVPPIRDNVLKLLEPLESLKASVLETAAVLYDDVTNLFNAIEFVAYNQFLALKGSFIQVHDIEGENFYQVFNTYMTAIYNQILQIEATELHKLGEIIKANSGTILD